MVPPEDAGGTREIGEPGYSISGPSPTHSAVLTAALHVLFGMLALVAPRIQILFDVQFFGANMASLFPKVGPSAASLITLVFHDRDVMGRGIRLGLAVQSVRTGRP
jgi:hypothetical protein